MASRRLRLTPIVVFVSMAAALIIAVIVGWSIIFPLYFAASFADATADAKVGLWIIMGVGLVFLCLVLVALGLFLAAVTRRHRLLHQQDTFIDTVTHELRTPLTSLRLCLETIDRHRLDPAAQAEFLKRMHGDVDRLHGLIEHVIETARLEHGAGSLRSEPVNVRAIITSCVQQVRQRYALAEGWCYLSCPPIHVYGDRTAIGSIVLNLLDNAAKYARDAPVAQISAQHDGQRMVLIVRDQGVGFVSSLAKRLFRRFVRLPLKRPVAGTGLGLYVIRELCRHMGGSVEAHSDGIDCGATFTVRLPLREVEGSSDGS